MRELMVRMERLWMLYDGYANQSSIGHSMTEAEFRRIVFAGMAQTVAGIRDLAKNKKDSAQCPYCDVKEPFVDDSKTHHKVLVGCNVTYVPCQKDG